VLIDEIDKAPRDFPNDLLNQIENLEFAVPELQIERIRAERAFAPVVIITSNSEKQLPEAFLRRCVYHHIEFPPSDKREQIESIVAARLRGLSLSGAGFKEALDFFYKLRDAGLVKKPSTSELLDWLRALDAHGLDVNKRLSEQKDIAQACLGSLVKTREDSAKAAELL
jgi:MoxR-like ATPase